MNKSPVRPYNPSYAQIQGEAWLLILTPSTQFISLWRTSLAQQKSLRQPLATVSWSSNRAAVCLEISSCHGVINLESMVAWSIMINHDQLWSIVITIHQPLTINHRSFQESFIRFFLKDSSWAKQPSKISKISILQLQQFFQGILLRISHVAGGWGTKSLCCWEWTEHIRWENVLHLKIKLYIYYMWFVVYTYTHYIPRNDTYGICIVDNGRNDYSMTPYKWLLYTWLQMTVINVVMIRKPACCFASNLLLHACIFFKAWSSLSCVSSWHGRSESKSKQTDSNQNLS